MKKKRVYKLSFKFQITEFTLFKQKRNLLVSIKYLPEWGMKSRVKL